MDKKRRLVKLCAQSEDTTVWYVAVMRDDQLMDLLNKHRLGKAPEFFEVRKDTDTTFLVPKKRVIMLSLERINSENEHRFDEKYYQRPEEKNSTFVLRIE